jgi:hypothetical protein
VRIQEVRVEHIPVARHLIFAAVQLASPIEEVDWDFDTEDQAWVWRSKPRKARIKEIELVLETVFSDRISKKPDVLIFPEYSVPKEALKRIDFQKLANQTSTIIVAGSYFESDLSLPLFFGQNICSIYVPNSEVVTIGKKHAAGAEKGLISATKLPNVARFIWHPDGQDPVSISIFLCRDYLTPFSERTTEVSDLSDGERGRLSVLDWDREGLNIVVMNNSKSQLFEGAAAFDARELHGKRKAVLLANCAMDDSDLGTALIVPSLTRERADIVASLPPRTAGILLAELRLWGGIEVRRSDPDTKILYPLRHVGLFAIDFSKSGVISAIKAEKPAPLSRGIWHPAFLEELRKIVVLDFFVARATLVTIEDAFSSIEQRIRHVKAGFVRGVQDIMIRRYVPRYLLKNGKVPLSLPFSYMSDDEMQKMFEVGTESSNLQVIVYPEKLLKYRGAKVAQGQAWNAAHELIKDVVLTSDINELIERSCMLAKEVAISEHGQDKFEFPKDIGPVFSLGVESYMPLGSQYGARKEYYVLISAPRTERDETPSEEFRKQIVLDFLMNAASVREISEVDSKPQKFHYAIQIEASTYEVDEIIYRMHVWAHDNRISFGTRTYEVWKYLSRESIAGIEHTTMDEFERDFLADARQLAGNIRSLKLTNEQRRQIASAWQKSRAMLARVSSSRKSIGEFYLYLALHNFQRAGYEDDYFKKCKGSWLDLYVEVEELSQQMLIKELELTPATGSKSVTKEQIALGIEGRLPEKTSKNADWKELRKYPARMLAQYYDDLTSGRGKVARFRKHLKAITDIRNWAAHTGRDGPFEEFVNLRQDDWQQKFKNIDLATTQISEAIFDLANLPR